ncbi:MAG: 2-hydroxyglutaryl-CoA dehydratase [Bacillota bacterium]|jgi:predicted nucleotide-binding protein (sugar kinase/HSP70/actin superfamily)|nr:2-hydroxyglutaryl-CoA dehydratase [Bacillota bacterium]
MKLTFPHIGDAHLVGRIFFSELGIEIVTPPYNTISKLEKGSGVSPDEICIPFKLMVANLMEAHAMGADTVAMPATMGPCRLGEYGELLKSILDKRGYKFHWILLDSSKAIGVRELLRRLSYLVSDSNKGLPEILLALNGTYRLIKGLEKLEQKAHLLVGYEEDRGACKKIITHCRRELSEAGSIHEALRSIRQHHKRLAQINVNRDKNPLHLLMTGEIYSMIEPFANHHMEEVLMDMGVSFEKRVTLGWWIDRTIVHPFQLKKQLLGNRYLPYEIGGYAKDTIAEGILCSRKGYDGVIQVFPVGCMPEIVAKAVFGKMMKEKKLSVLTVIYDEMGGEAGYITRIEAFVDMLSRRKRIEEKQKYDATMKKNRGKINVLPGH